MNVALVCPQGHDSSGSSTKFCIECGAVLTPAVQQVQLVQPSGCFECGGEGARLDSKTHVCKQCRWLRPLAPGYAVDCAAFQYAQDGSAMAVLRASGPLCAAARAISDHIGRRWIETTFNCVRLGPNQLPHVFDQAVLAARILGMSYMPDIYVSGERMWDAMTFGSDQNSFILLGTALLTNFRGSDLLFLLAREIGHCRAGHALWKTVIKFLVGEQGPKKGFMSNGLISALNPMNLVEGALEMPLLAWARQAEITSDRAGLLAIGNEEIARRVLLSWSLKSSMLYKQINIQAWMDQENEGGDELTKLSEMITSSTPYITRRLKLMAAYSASRELQHYRSIIERFLPSKNTVKAEPSAFVKVTCPHCAGMMRVSSAATEGKEQLNVRCPNPKCGKIMTLRKKPNTQMAGGIHA